MALDVFNLNNLPNDKAKLGAYGDARMKTLIKYYGSSKSVGDKVFPPQIDGKKCPVQWKLFKHNVQFCAKPNCSPDLLETKQHACSTERSGN